VKLHRPVSEVSGSKNAEPERGKPPTDEKCHTDTFETQYDLQEFDYPDNEEAADC
jgi:hypothetical protein